MPTLLTLAMLVTMFSMAFPPLIIVAAILWWLLIRTGRRKVRVARARIEAQERRKAQSTYDKAVRYFSS